MFVPILAYHKIRKTFDFSVTYVSPKQFAAQVKYLVNSGFQTVSINDYILKKNIGEKKVIITFDDACASVFQHALPILNKYNFKATIFAITQFVGAPNRWDYFQKKGLRHCSWEELRILASKGWEVGSHTVSHPNLRNLSEAQLWEEIKASKDILEDNLQIPINLISYPFGKFDKRVINMVAKAGYSGGCTLGYNYPHNQQFPYALFRRGVYLFEPLKIFQVKLQNNNWSHFDDIKQKVITFCSQGTLLLRYLKSL